MAHSSPQYFFRIREQDIAVFLVDTSNRLHRINLKMIASVDINTHHITPKGFRVLSQDELTLIHDWLAAREARGTAPHQRVNDIYDVLDQLNMATQWAYNEASGAEIEALIDPLMLAMHDLRTVLVHKHAEHKQRTKNESS